jgi:uncharacterized protein with ParB-like and HNH nuclease domain/predicted transport protein
MKAIDRPFTKIINGITQFVIPVFQRDYSWTEAECEQLWQDVTEIARDSTERGHFLGSVVYISTGDTSAGFTRWLLIDGQQRVTTLVLLLTALRDHIDENGWVGDDDGPTARRVDAYFLKNVQEEGNRLHKLVLRRHDETTLKALIDRTELPAEPSDRVRDNYEFFRDQLNKTDPGLVYHGIGRLIIVDVTLDRGTDDPQLIFESLNSTGMDLSQSDLIRNFILMRLPEREREREREQTLFYENYWSKIESLFRGSEKTFDAFVRDYIALHTQASKQEKTSNIYSAFRRVPMSEEARTLFDQLRVKVLEIDTNVIELAEQKSVSYHGPGFFLEILPRKNRITLLLDLDFNEVDDPSNIARDASEYKFLVNAVHEGGVLVSILDADDIEKSLPLIRQAWERG